MLGEMSRLELRAFTDEHLDAAGSLLAVWRKPLLVAFLAGARVPPLLRAALPLHSLVRDFPDVATRIAETGGADPPRPVDRAVQQLRAP